MSEKKTAFDIIQEERRKLVEIIIENLDKKGIEWFKEWSSLCTPHNGINGTEYHGGNKLKLGTIALLNDYKDPRWATFKQIADKGYKLNKGAKGVVCEHWRFSKTIEEVNAETGEIEKKNVPLRSPSVSYFKVFNFTEVEGAPPFEIPERIKDEKIQEVIRNLEKSSKCLIEYENQDRACYIPSKDVILLPNQDLFINDLALASTLLHEMAHSTGHKERLDRDLTGEFGSPNYAREELRAEISSMFLQNQLNLPVTDRQFENNQEYIRSWISILDKDPNEIYRASSDAEEIANFIVKEYKGIEQTVELEKSIKEKEPQIQVVDILALKKEKEQEKELEMNDD